MSTALADLEARSGALRHDLKGWEKEFAAANGGKKAGRDDIKACPAIAAKYKEYNKVRLQISKGHVRETTPEKDGRKRKANDLVCTPSKRSTKPSTPSHACQILMATPSKHAQTSAAATPTSKLATPAISRTMIGPTPQRNGVVIGLFDLLPAETPTKAERTILGEVQPNSVCTPSRRDTPAEDELCLTGRKQTSRTPMSSGKRFFLDTFATPLKRKSDDTLSPEFSRHQSTPTFLRRNASLDLIEEEEEYVSKPLPWKRKGLVRSLSTMIQDIKERKEEERRQEEDRLDEDLDLLRQLENEEAGVVRSPKKKPKLLVEDSQAVEMRLGPDQLEESGDEDEGAQANRPTRVWKKKGQKRQTRRVIMRPNRMQPGTATELDRVDSDDEATLETVRETQAMVDGDGAPDDAFVDGNSDGDSDASEPDGDKRQAKRRTQKTGAKDAQADKEGTFRKVVRKVNEQAHANFRRLKIKSKNGTGKGRVGRRR